MNAPRPVAPPHHLLARFAVLSAATFAVVGIFLQRLLADTVADLGHVGPGPVPPDIASDQARLSVLLAAGLFFLWAGTVKLVHESSRSIREQARRSEHAALHDPLTRLANRALLISRAEQAVEMARRRGNRVGLMLLDLDGFKEINDTLGHPVGDELLVEVGRRIQDRMRSADTVSRLGGDEFAVLLPDLVDEAGARRAAEAVEEAFAESFAVAGGELDVRVSIGVAVYPDHAADVDELLQRADVAMYEAKREGGRFELYADTGDDPGTDRLALLGELRKAVAQGDLLVHYQPKVDLLSGAVHGMEALVRWKHPARGLITAADFVPLAESAGLMHQLTSHVLGTALDQHARWRAEGLDLDLAVNLSARDLHDLDFPHRLRELLRRFDLEPGRLVLEVTETALIAEPRRALAVLTELAAAGVRVAVDDFGTGYSSVSYLKSLPIDAIKVDRSFVAGMAANPDDHVIVRSTIGLAQTLGLDVVAEGIETGAVWRQLVADGCELGQGFLIARPMDAETATRWMRWAKEQPPLDVVLQGLHPAEIFTTAPRVDSIHGG